MNNRRINRSGGSPKDPLVLTRTSPSNPSSSNSRSKLSQQYGGRHTAGWVNHLPASFIPYIQLARLSPPVGVCLVLFPHVFGFLHGALLLESTAHASAGDPMPIPSSHIFLLPWIRSYLPAHFTSLAFPFSYPRTVAIHLVRPGALLIGGSFFLSNTIHGWNDLIDAPYDALVTRTRERPIVRGAVSKRGAFIFTFTQGMAGCAMLALLLPNPVHSMQIAIPSILANLYYPFAKRHTHFAQYVLGVCLAWGVVVGTAGALESAGGEGQAVQVWFDAPTRTSTACLTAAAMLWTVIYDTIYAFQDCRDDVKIGLKSTAVLFGEWTRLFLGLNLGLLVGLLAYVGILLRLQVLYFGFAVGGFLVALGTMIVKVDLKDPGSCWWWFRYGFWLAGGSIAMGLFLECLL